MGGLEEGVGVNYLEGLSGEDKCAASFIWNDRVVKNSYVWFL